jgi:hypothetical protein
VTALGEALAAVGPLAERSRRVVEEAAFASRAHGTAVQKKRADLALARAERLDRKAARS